MYSNSGAITMYEFAKLSFKFFTLNIKKEKKRNTAVKKTK